MKNIENKSIVTGKQLDKAGYEHLVDSDEGAVFVKGYDRIIYQRLRGKTERYKLIRHYVWKGGIK